MNMEGCQREQPRPHLLLIIPPGWQDHPPGLVALRDHLHDAFGASLSLQTATSFLRVPVPLFSGRWPSGVDACLAPLIEHAFFILHGR